MNLNSPEQIEQLLEKFQRQACSQEEIQQLHAWLELQAASGAGPDFVNEEDKLLVKNRIQGVVLSSIAAQTANTGRWNNKKRWLGYAAVAAGVLLVVVGVTWFSQDQPREIIVASAPGRIDSVVLPDGSKVWLNSNTELAYHSNFARKRTLELRRGEAFFEVHKDSAHPFTVQSQEVNTVVKGTSFSVKRVRLTGDIKVSVVTGKVLVSRQHDTLGFLLPHQRLRYAAQNRLIKVDSILTGEANGWVKGELFLQNASLAEVIQWLQDHFNVKVDNKHRIYGGEYYLQAKNDISLPEILKILNLLGKKNHVQFSLDNRTIFIQ